jgi:hypothetical protein
MKDGSMIEWPCLEDSGGGGTDVVDDRQSGEHLESCSSRGEGLVSSRSCREVIGSCGARQLYSHCHCTGVGERQGFTTMCKYACRQPFICESYLPPNVPPHNHPSSDNDILYLK